MITSMASTLTLSQKLRGDDYRRGFNIIELNRDNDIVTSVSGRIFEISESNIIDLNTDDDDYSWKVKY
jgi:hypothetical protein